MEFNEEDKKEIDEMLREDPDMRYALDAQEDLMGILEKRSKYLNEATQENKNKYFWAFLNGAVTASFRVVGRKTTISILRLSVEEYKERRMEEIVEREVAKTDVPDDVKEILIKALVERMLKRM